MIKANVKRYFCILLAMILFSVNLSIANAEPAEQPAGHMHSVEQSATNAESAEQPVKNAEPVDQLSQEEVETDEEDTDDNSPENIVFPGWPESIGLDGEISAQELAQTTVEIEVPTQTANTGGTRRVKRDLAPADPAEPQIGIDHPGAQGDVLLFKQAKPVNGEKNSWDITLRIEAKDIKKKSDIVLVIDRSGSMRDNNRMFEAKEAAKKFVASLLPSDQTRIAVVSYSGDVRIDQGFTNDRNSLNTKIDSLWPDGGTFTQAGIKQADALLKASDADFKHIVLLSDGEPTYAYDLDLRQRDRYLVGKQFNGTEFSYSTGSVGVNYSWGRLTSGEIPENEFTTTRVGNGRRPIHLYATGNSYDRLYNARFYDLANHTVMQASYAKNRGQSLWTIALEAGDNGTEILKKVATDGQAKVATPEQLEEIFGEIAGKIQTTVQEAQVTDPMGGGFTVPLGTIGPLQPTQGTARFDETTRTLHWQIGHLKELVPGETDIRYAELTYRVTVDDHIFDATAEADGSFRTNGDAVIKYTDYNGKVHEKHFPGPVVRPKLLTIRKRLIDSNGREITNFPPNGQVSAQDERTFELEVRAAAQADVQTYEFEAGQRHILREPKTNTVYTLRETGADLTDYEVNYQIPTEIRRSANSFVVEDNDADADIVIVNREKKLGKLSITKQFEANPTRSDLTPSTAAGGPGTARRFSFKVFKDGVEQPDLAFELTAGETKELSGLAYGSYQVIEATEADLQTPTYQDDEGGNADRKDGTVLLQRTDKEHHITVTNRPAEETLRLTVKKHWDGGTNDDRPSVTFHIRADGQETGQSIILDRQGQTTDSWTQESTDLLRYDSSGRVIDYTLTEAAVDGYESGTITKSGDRQFEVTNTRRATFILKKRVTGTMADRNRRFRFRVIVDGVEQTVDLADGEEQRFLTQKGAQITVIETDAISGNYQVTATNGAVINDMLAKTATLQPIKMGVEDIEVIVTNHRDAPTDGGLITGQGGWLLLILAMIMILSVVIGRRRQPDA
ncbi:MAG: VWA domain-containing protein [Eubacteriales bacterium]|nr:VWA domain-containing protein [Eubacteriales bacterium]